MSESLLRSCYSCFVILAGLWLGGCTTSETPQAAAEPPQRQGELRDFSGHWEKNYQLSDDFNARFGLYVADIQRLLASQGRSDISMPLVRGGGVSTDAINGLARFTEELTRMPLMEISQDDALIEIEREDDFTLRCAYQDRQFVNSTNTFGTEVCGWNAERLQFRMTMAGGLMIAHQFSISADASLLNVTTTVSSDAVAVPMVVSNYYQRFEPPEEDFNCVLTLTRSRVCNQRGTPR